VNRNTVAKAYTELESQGIIETIAGKGCFIRANNSRLKKEVRVELLNIESSVIAVDGLVRRYGNADAVAGLNLRVPAGGCYGFFGRNGAGKTTTIKCLLNLLRPTKGTVRIFGLDPARDELAVKSRIAYVSFRARWNHETERALLEQFRLDARKNARRRTVFVSTHLISELEGLIDRFTIIENGRDVLTLDADVARERYQKIFVATLQPGGVAA
jgi:ABC-type multidrug transport system ATPase subunit